MNILLALSFLVFWPLRSTLRSITHLGRLDAYGECVSLPVNADMGRGSLTCFVNLKVVDGLSFDLVLGRDWFAYYQEYLISEGLLLSNGPVDRDDCDDGSDKITGVSSYFFF